MSDKVTIPRNVAEILRNCAMFAPPSVDRFFALEVLRQTLDNPPVAPAGLMVSRPLLATLHRAAVKHRNLCDIGRTEHAECGAATFITAQMLGVPYA